MWFTGRFELRSSPEGACASYFDGKWGQAGLPSDQILEAQLGNLTTFSSTPGAARKKYVSIRIWS